MVCLIVIDCEIVMTQSSSRVSRDQFMDGMARLINLCVLEYEILGKNDALPEGYSAGEDEECLEGVVSLGEIAAMLNERRHGTIYNKRWTRHSLKMLLEELESKGVKFNIGHKSCKTKNANKQRSNNADEYAKEVFETYLKRIDHGKMTMSELARELNGFGSRTIRGNLWSAAGCDNLVKRLESNNLI